MKLLMYGVNRDSVSADEIHKYSLTNELRTQHLQDIKLFDGVREVVILITENRNEYYLFVDEKVFKHGDLLRYFSDYTSKPLEEIILETYSKFNEDVVKHLLNISSNIHLSSHYAYEPLEVIDNALMEALNGKSVGPILYALFKTVLEFTLTLCDKDSIKPLLQHEVYRSVRLIREIFSGKESRDYLFVGNHPIINQIMKHFIDEPDSSITIVERSKEDKEVIKKIEKWLILMNQSHRMKNIYTVTFNELSYRLSKADVVVIGPSIQHALISEELIQEMYEVRPGAKKQLFFDFSTAQNETLFSKYKNLLYKHINDEPEAVYSDEELEEAEVIYDELLTDYTTHYMDYVDQLQEQKPTAWIRTKQSTHFMSYTKKISHRA